MEIIMDIIIIATLLLSTFLGYKKGLIGVAFKIVSFFIAIIITLILFKPISNYIINHTEISKNIENEIIQRLEISKIEEGEIKQEENNLPKVVINYINQEIQNTAKEAEENILKIVAKNLTETIINIIVMIGLFIITRLLLLFAKAILEAVSEIPIVKQFNEIGGLIYGILRGLLVIYIILTVISFLLPMLDSKTILSAINRTILTKIFYNNNLILMIFF